MIQLKTKELEEYVLLRTNKTKENLLLQDIANIKTINLNSVTIDNKFEPIYFEDLQYFRNLESLYISNANISGEDLRYIFSLSNLRTLSFYDCTIDNFNGIHYLNKLENLYISKLNYSDINEIGLLQSLKTLSLIGIEFNSLDILLPLTKLEMLDIGYSKVNDCKSIGKFTSLVNLSVVGIENLDIDTVLNLPNLQELKVSSNVIDKIKADANAKKIKIYNERHIFGDGIDV